MPSGAKKRKALKKKQQQESSRTSTNNKGFNGDNLHGNGSQDESDSNLSSPGSQGNEEFGAKDPSAKEISGDQDVTQGLGQKSGNGIAVAERGADDKKVIVEKPVKSASQEPCDNSITEIALLVDSVKPVVKIPEKSEHAEPSTHSSMVSQKSGENKEYPSAAEASKKLESVREPEAPVSSEEKRILLPGPPAVRTSWLSCCGLFDAMSGSDR